MRRITICLYCSMMYMTTFIFSVAAEVTTPKVTGFIKTAYAGHSGQPSEMKVTNVRVRVTGSIDETTGYTFFVDPVRDNILLDAVIIRRITSALELRFGQFKTPFGSDNLISATRYPFINRGYLKSAVSPPFRDIGVQLSHCSRYLELYAGIMNGAGANKPENNTNKIMTYRLAAHPTHWLTLTGNYSRGVTTTDGGTTEYYDAGFDGLFKAISYMGEYARRHHRGATSHVAAAWITCDLLTGIGAVPVITPALKCECYDPDSSMGDDAISCYTLGFSAHFTENKHNRVMLNYEHRSTDSSETDRRAGIEYMVWY